MNYGIYATPALRRAGRQFLTGKAASAVLTFSILLWLVRVLPVVEYGAYITLIAGIELGFPLASLGLPWLAARYLPDYRLHASGIALIELCRRLLVWQAMALIALAVILAAALDAYLTWADLLPFRTPAFIYLGVLVGEGLARFMRDQVMSSLMLQGESRLSQVLRQVVFIALIAALGSTNAVGLVAVAWAELAASLAGFAIAAYLLWRHLRELRSVPGQPEWTEPDLAGQWHVATRMYSSQLLTLACSANVFINIVQRVLGTEATALFGFVRNLYTQVSGYLPATLLFSLIRPKLMAGLASSGITEFARNANLAGKLSLFALMPLIAMVAIGGDALVALLSGGKFVSGGALLLGFMFALVSFSQRQLIESVAVATGRAGVCVWAAAAGLVTLPLVWVLINNGFGLWAPTIGIILGAVLFNTVVVALTRSTGYRKDWRGAMKIVGAALLAYLAAAWLPMGVLAPDMAPWLALGGRGALALCVYLACAWWLKPFTDAERDRLNVLIGRRLFM